MSDEEIEIDSTDYYQHQDDARADIETAFSVLAKLDEMDLDSPKVLRWNLKRELKSTERRCYEIIIDRVKCLHSKNENIDSEKEEEEAI